MTEVIYTKNGLTFTYDDGDLTDLSVLADIDMRTGTPVDETAWLDGGAAAGSYPGALAGFNAKNSNTTDANGSLRMLIVKYDIEDVAVEPVTLSGNISKIVGILGSSMSVADKTLSVTHSGLVVNSHAEAAADNCTFTLLYLGA